MTANEEPAAELNWTAPAQGAAAGGRATAAPNRAARLVTVLWPGSPGAATPTVEWLERGQLRIGGDLLCFDLAADGSAALRTVNGRPWTDTLNPAAMPPR